MKHPSSVYYVSDTILSDLHKWLNHLVPQQFIISTIIEHNVDDETPSTSHI